jgi:hypothetical protein
MSGPSLFGWRAGGSPSEILDRWYGEDHAYFKLTGRMGPYIIRQDRGSDTWELILTEVPTRPLTEAGR